MPNIIEQIFNQDQEHSSSSSDEENDAEPAQEEELLENDHSHRSYVNEEEI